MNRNKTIIFNKNQIAFLTSILKSECLLKKFSQNFGNKNANQSEHNSSQEEISFSELEIEIILDDLSYELTLNGIDDQGEVNKKGELIEEIIDLFSNH